MDADRRDLQPGAGTKLSREQKAGFIFVVACGLCALVLGGQYLWTHMASPFAVNYTGPEFFTGTEQEAQQIATQRRADSDSDTISDYDELYIYKTSPYLADSDSDGLQDGQEITSGQDPNCALGAACEARGNEDVVTPNGSASLDAEAETLAARQQALDAALAELSALQPAEIRILLVESGASQAEVDAMTDSQISLMYQSVISDLIKQAESTTAAPGTTIVSPTTP